MKIAIVFAVLFGVVDSHYNGGIKHPVPTYFKTTYDNGTLIDRTGPDYAKFIPDVFVEHISRHDAITASLMATPRVVANGGTVTATWKGIENPTSKDFVAFYCPHDDAGSKYLDYWHVNGCPNWKTGNSNKSVTVFNLRSVCEFRYYRNDNYAQLVATSNRFTFENGGPLAPLQGHIASTGEPSQMRVMWVSAPVEQPLVAYGLSEELVMIQTDGLVHTYNVSDMCESGASNPRYFRDPGHIHDFVLTGLKPNTRYYYAYGTREFMSETFNFTTDLPRGHTRPHTFITYGDMGIQGNPGPDDPAAAERTDALVLKEVQEKKARYIVHNGDVSYARGMAYIWDQWFALVEPYATLVPYMAGVGNHEQDHENGNDPSGAGTGFHPIWGNLGYDSNGECGVPMFHRFKMPPNGNAVWWYSWEYGLVHHIMMSTEHDYTPGSRQYRWLEHDLRTIDRTVTPWVLIYGHRPMYTSEGWIQDFANYKVSLGMQRMFEDLLYKYRVDVAVWSHYHLYERTCPLYMNTCVKGGVTHITSGGAGAALETGKWHKTDWSKFRIIDWGYGRATVANHTHFLYEFVQNRSGKVIDSVWLVK